MSIRNLGYTPLYPYPNAAKLKTVMKGKLCWSTDMYGTDCIMKRGAGVYILTIYKRQIIEPKLTIPTGSFSFSMLPKTRRIISRHPTPHPSLLVSLEYPLVGLLYDRLTNYWRTTKVCATGVGQLTKQLMKELMKELTWENWRELCIEKG